MKDSKRTPLASRLLGAASLILLAVVSWTAAPRAAEPAAAIAGAVVDAKGAPVAGAVVLACQEASSARARMQEARETGKKTEGARLAETKTGTDGTFRLEVPAGGALLVRAEAQGFAPAVAKEVAAGATVRFVLSPGHAVEGQVVERGSGRPIEGAKVLALEVSAVPLRDPDDPDRLARQATTDRTGRFKLASLAADDHVVSVSLPGKLSIRDRRVSVGRKAGATEPLYFQMEPGAVLVGKVADAAGKPVSGARVTARPGRGSASFRDLRAWMELDRGGGGVTDEKGAFEISGIPRVAAYEIDVTHDDFAPAWVDNVKTDGAGRSAPVSVTLEKGTALSGTLLVGEEPFTGKLSLSVSYGEAVRGWMGPGRMVTRSSTAPGLSLDKGAFRADRLPAGTADVTISAEGFREVVKEGLTLRAGEPLDLGQILLERGPAISGRTVDAQGNGVAGVVVSARSISQTGMSTGEATSAADGSFVVGGLVEGASFDLEARSDDRGSASARGVKPGGEPVTLALVPSGTLRGAVVTGDPPAPVESFSVEIVPKADPGSMGLLAAAGFGNRKETFRDAGGLFVVKNADAGTVTVRIRADGFVEARRENIEVTPGGTADLGDVKLSRGATLHGAALDRRTRMPVGGATVALEEGGLFAMMREMNADPSGQVLTRPDGRFELRGLAPGRHTVRVDHDAHAPGKAEVEIVEGALDADATLELGEGGAIEGIVRDKSGLPQAGQLVVATAGMSVSSRATGSTDDAGHYRIEHLSPGPYVVVSVAGGGRRGEMTPEGMKMQSATVEEGRTTVVNLPPSGGGVAVKGKVLSGKKPIEARLFWVKTTAAGGPADLASCSSSADGSFEVRVAGPGSYQVRVQPADAKSMEAGYGVTVDLPAGPAVTKDIVLPQSSVAGRVVNGDTSEPLRGVQVTALRLGADGEVEARNPVGTVGTTKEDGSYVLEGLAEGTYRITFQLPEHGTEEIARLEIGDDDRKEDRNAALRKAPSLPVRVTGDGGQPIQGAFVYPRRRAFLQGGLEGVTDPDGRVVIRSLMDGTHDLVALAPGYAPGSARSVAVGPDVKQEVEIRLARGFETTVRVTDSSGKPAPDLGIRIREDGGEDLTLILLGQMVMSGRGFSIGTDATGTAALPPLEPGSYEMTLFRGDEKVARKSFAVRAGEANRVEVKLQ